nr:RNA polymerase sigma factor [Sedimentibacter sp.]
MKGNVNMEDFEIVELLMNRIEKALQEVREKYHKLCIKVSNDITKSILDTDECVNDSYMKLWNAIPPNRPDSLKAFLLRIVKNTSIDRIRRNISKMRGCELTLVYDELDECLADDKNPEDTLELKEVINDFLGNLEEGNRRIFMKRYWYVISISEIAREEGLKESTIKMRLMRMRNKLKVKLEQEDLL